ncbi:MAG: hypothetical protein ABW133_05655 [Polyangiaceae bacterium]
MRNLAQSILLSFFAAAPGCINADPSNFLVDAGVDAPPSPPVDADIDDSGDAPDPYAACKACLEAPEVPGPGCKTAVDACKADESCLKVYECAFEQKCIGLPSVPEILLCGFTKCNTPLGVPYEHPATALAQALVVCEVPKCNPIPCGPNL